LPLDDLLGLLKLSSAGKLMSGLVHNLNGLLQNLGMEMELMNHSLMGEETLSEDQVDAVHTRLKRMQAEFERISSIIKIATMRASLSENYNSFLSINEFLRREISFFEANLYFKHNVHTEFQLHSELPALRNPPKDLELALSWFMQSIIEELEREQIKRLILKTSLSHSGAEIMISTGGENLSERFIELFNLEIPTSEPLKIVDHNAGVILVVALLKSVGISVTGRVESSGPHIILTIPIN
jgi:hypothetical protein